MSIERQMLRQELLSLAEDQYKTFTAGLIPGCESILGVRLPALRKLAKTIAKEDWQTYLATPLPDPCHEELMLEGMVIGAVKTDFPTKLSLIEAFLPKITNWAVCDSFVAGLKMISRHQEDSLPLLDACLSSGEEFRQRFALVVYLNYYLEPPYLERIFTACDTVTLEGYYAKMAAAWLLSMCYVKFPERTQDYLAHCTLEDEIFNKTLQKTVESRQIPTETKNRLRRMKRK